MNSTDISYLPIWSRYQVLFLESGLTYEEIGQLLCAMMRFYFSDIEPADLPNSLKYCWVLLKSDLTTVKEKYITAVTNGKKGGRPKKQKTEPKPNETQHNPEKPITITITESIQNNTKQDIDTRSAPSLPDEREGMSPEKQSFGEFGWVKLTQEQYQRLGTEMGYEELDRCIAYVDESAQCTNNRNRWKDWFLILRRCHRDGWHQERERHREKIPKGASGILGEAELEAIQRVLSQ